MMNNRTIYLTVALSTGLHLAVLLPMMSHQQTIIIDAPTRPVSSIALVVTATDTPKSQKQATNNNAEQTTRKAIAKPAPSTPVTKHVAVTKTAVTEEVDDKPAERPAQLANSTDPQALVDHDMLEYLHSEFRVRFVYPLLARKRGWAGEVVIALNVNQRGIIDHIAVQKSSGYPVLDNNAVATFRAIGLVSPAIQSRINNRHQLSIPVVYRLTCG